MSQCFTFPAEARMRKRWQFNYVYRMGCKKNTPHFLILMSVNREKRSRLGLTVSRKVGNAIVRNRIKRMLREYFRLNIQQIFNSYDISIIAKRGCGGLTSLEILKELEILFE